MRKWVIIVALVAVMVAAYEYRVYLYVLVTQPQMFLPASLDTEAPPIELADGPAILSFSKTNGFRHGPAIAASREMLDRIAEQESWQVFHTENGAAFTPAILAQFDLILLNHKTGHTWDEAQRQALRDYIEQGGTLIALHAAGDASNHVWPWYREQVIRADFVDHPLKQHIQVAQLLVEIQNHPATEHLPGLWSRADEWYNFAHSPRSRTNVLVSILESSYDPETSPMGADHPMVWWHTVGQGRVFYSALGHTPESYTDTNFVRFVTGALRWGLNPHSSNNIVQGAL